MPTVSVILPVYNRSASVARAIESVLAQTYRDYELIVVDDGSTDDTRRVVDSFGDRLIVLEQPHAGAYVARNLALRHARGELIAFIDSDDVWLAERLELQVPLMERPEVGLVFGDGEIVPLRRLRLHQVTPPRRGRVAAHFAWGNFVPTCTVLVRRRCLDGFAETNAVSADYLAWFRIALRHELDYVDAPVAEYTVHTGGISYDLGRSLEARIQLFSDELARTTDDHARAILRRLLFNLSLNLVLATVRGRAKNVSHPLRLAWRTASSITIARAAPWSAAFALHQLRIRAKRIR
jgi:glycosyltransferase involved in cell wall biosynthesis